MKIDSKVCEGAELLKTPPMASVGTAKYKFIGTLHSVGFDNDLLSKHIAFLGSIGVGKTVAITQLVGQIKRSMSRDDILIFFDSKGEFRQMFRTEGDIVISNETAKSSNYWNIFAEIEGGKLEENISEISRNLFYEKLRDAKEPFFPNAAKDLFGAVLHMFWKYETNGNGVAKSARNFCNQALRTFFALALRTR
jgi:type IV secretory pathway TraG/TraD family ATPase VirD4